MLRAAAISLLLISGAFATGPNIILILVDDLGKEWVSAYGAERITTPHIDRLAADGLLFHNAYSMPQCTPSRVTLLTGQYPYRHGWVNHWDVPRWGKGAHFDTRKYLSIGKVMKAAGYRTCAAGKWQIDDFRTEPDAMRDAGFDSWCMWTGAESNNMKASSRRYWNPYIYKSGGSKTYEGKFGPDLFARFVFNFISDNKKQPFFVYWPMVLTHGPLVHTPLSPKAKGKMEKHKAMTLYVDHLVKQLREQLANNGLSENTLIIFTTDNGTARSITGTRLGSKVRGGKGQITENGINAPFIACWPGHIKAGTQTKALVDFTDFLPTFAQLAGADFPEEKTDGSSFSEVLSDPGASTAKTHIVALGSGPARFVNRRVVPEVPFKERSIRTRRWKVQVDAHRRITRLHDLEQDPWEKTNLTESANPEAEAAMKRFRKIIAGMPAVDASPQYEPNGPALP